MSCPSSVQSGISTVLVSPAPPKRSSRRPSSSCTSTASGKRSAGGRPVNLSTRPGIPASGGHRGWASAGACSARWPSRSLSRAAPLSKHGSRPRGVRHEPAGGAGGSGFRRHDPIRSFRAHEDCARSARRGSIPATRPPRHRASLRAPARSTRAQRCQLLRYQLGGTEPVLRAEAIHEVDRESDHAVLLRPQWPAGPCAESPARSVGLPAPTPSDASAVSEHVPAPANHCSRHSAASPVRPFCVQTLQTPDCWTGRHGKRADFARHHWSASR